MYLSAFRSIFVDPIRGRLMHGRNRWTSDELRFVMLATMWWSFQPIQYMLVAISSIAYVLLASFMSAYI